MKKFIITEDERSRILEMHKSAISRQYLMEQSGTTPTGQTQTPTEVKLTGNGAAALRSIPNIVIKPGTDPNRPFLQTKGLDNLLVQYLGGQQSRYKDILNKQILIFKDKGLLTSDGNGVYLEGGNVDTVLAGTFVPKAAYFGNYGTTYYIYLFENEITTNFSGDENKPYIQADGTSAITFDPNVKAILKVSTKGDGSPAEDEGLRGKTLIPSQVKYLRIRQDGYVDGTAGLKGFAEYLPYLGFPMAGTMMGVAKAK